jgi:hypothetical protein
MNLLGVMLEFPQQDEWTTLCASVFKPLDLNSHGFYDQFTPAPGCNQLAPRSR